jgi:hypothetical protein
MQDSRDICLKKVYHLGCDHLTARKVAEHLERLVAEEADRRLRTGEGNEAQAQNMIDECTVEQIDGPSGTGGYDYCMCFVTLKSNKWGQLALDLFNSVITHGFRWSAVWGRSKARHNARGYNDPQKVYTYDARSHYTRCKSRHCDLCAPPALTSSPKPNTEPSRTVSQHMEPQEPVKLSSMVFRVIQNSQNHLKTIKKTRKNSQKRVKHRERALELAQTIRNTTQTPVIFHRVSYQHRDTLPEANIANTEFTERVQLKTLILTADERQEVLYNLLRYAVTTRQCEGKHEDARRRNLEVNKNRKVATLERQDTASSKGHHHAQVQNTPPVFKTCIANPTPPPSLRDQLFTARGRGKRWLRGTEEKISVSENPPVLYKRKDLPSLHSPEASRCEDEEEPEDYRTGWLELSSQMDL